MPAKRKTNQSNRLTAAGLIAVTAATLLMMAWAIFPTPAFADGQNTVTWTGNGSTNLPCTGGETQWQLAGFGNIKDTNFTVVTLIVNNVDQGAPDSDTGGTFKWQVPGPGTTADKTTASATYEWTGTAPDNVPQLTISHCEGATTSPPPAPGSITVVKQTNPDGSAQKFEFDTDYGSNFSLADGEQNDSGDLVAGTYSVAEVNIPAGWSLTSATCSDQSNPNSINLAAGEHVTCTFTNTQNATTTTPGGGGGGVAPTTTTTTTTTTTIPTVAPTTIHKSTTTDEVLPTTVKPGGTAFTGVENVVPIGAIALTLLTSGSGLLWAGSRRRRQDGSEDQD